MEEATRLHGFRKDAPFVRVIYADGSSNAAANLICVENGSSGYNTPSGSFSAGTLTIGNIYDCAACTSMTDAAFQQERDFTFQVSVRGCAVAGRL